MPDLPDGFADVLARAKSGDTAAINDLLATFRPDIRQWIEKECGNQAAAFVDVSGVTQNALLCVHRELSKFRGTCRDEFRAWIKRISMNRLIDDIRGNCAQKRNVREIQSLETIDEPGNRLRNRIAGDTSSPSVKASRNEQLAVAIAKLPVEQQAIAAGHFIEKLGIEKLAAHCGTSPEKAALLLERAVRNLRKHLRPQD